MRWLVDKGETFSKSAAANAAKEKIESSGDDNDTSGDHFWRRGGDKRDRSAWLDPRCGLDMPVLERGGGHRPKDLHTLRAEIASLRQRIKQQSNTAHGSEEEAILSKLRLKRKRAPPAAH